MRHALLLPLALAVVATTAGAQRAGRFPPDSLVNNQVFADGTPMPEVLGAMRSFAGALGVRCTYCHVGAEGAPLAQLDFASDEKRTKLVAREMMRMVRDINRRLDTLPARPTPAVTVGCATCHRGVTRPVPLATIVADAAIAVNADSATRAYRLLRERHYGRDAYDFGERTVTEAALRVARAGKPDDALALLRLQDELFPQGAAGPLARGTVLLGRRDTTGAVASFREALKRDPNNGEARNRLRELGVQ